MASLPRLLVVMGSGETSPTMVKVHRELFGRIGDAPAVILDTPVGFQMNARGVSAKAVEYFRVSLNRNVEVASFLSTDDPPVQIETALRQLRDAGYVFAGPGSPRRGCQNCCETNYAAVDV
jgi:hypothetical protein